MSKFKMGSIKVAVVDLTNEEKQLFDHPVNIKRVVIFNSIQLKYIRKMYVDILTKRFYYKSPGANRVRSYSTDREKYQSVTVDGVVYKIIPDYIFIEMKFPSKENNEAEKLTLQLNGVYRLNNDKKIQIVAKVLAGEFSKIPYWLGIHDNGVVRYSLDSVMQYSLDGKILLYSDYKDWDIKEEWEDKFLWTVTVKTTSSSYITHTFTNEEQADQHIKKSTNRIIAKTKIKI